MDSDDFLGLIRQTVREEMANASFAIGTVDTVDGTSASVRFDGETSASVKKYPAVGYSPVAGDRVVLSLVGRSWVILGKIGSASMGGDHPDSDHGDAFSSVGHNHDEVPLSSGNELFVWRNLAALDINVNNSTGAIVINSGIPRASPATMTRTRVAMYIYDSNPILDITIACYWYSGSWPNKGYTQSAGSTRAPGVQVGEDADGNVVYVIGGTGDSWDYPQIYVPEFAGGFNGRSWMGDNWSISQVTDLSSYANLTTVPLIS